MSIQLLGLRYEEIDHIHQPGIAELKTWNDDSIQLLLDENVSGLRNLIATAKTNRVAKIHILDRRFPTGSHLSQRLRTRLVIGRVVVFHPVTFDLFLSPTSRLVVGIDVEHLIVGEVGAVIIPKLKVAFSQYQFGLNLFNSTKVLGSHRPVIQPMG